jgi:hypothetical protein
MQGHRGGSQGTRAGLHLPVRFVPFLVASLVACGLYWGLSQAESRAIYASWDKVLHGAVFFLMWWLLRWGLRISWLWLTALVVFVGGAEEIHQLFKVGQVASWGDFVADVVGAGLALAIYAMGNLLWLLRSSAEVPEASAPADGVKRNWGTHPVDWRGNLRFWRWDFYFVLIAGHERRALSRREQAIARWTLGFLLLAFGVFAAAAGAIVLFLIKVALGV